VRVAVYYANDDVRLEERERPVAGPGELLMRVEASGICGSDTMEWYRKPKAPIVLGHEVAGVVEEVGAGVDDFASGDRIVTTHHVPCNACRYCETDRHAVCELLHGTTFDPGGFSEYVRLPAVNVERGTFHLPDSVGFDEGSFVEPLACVIRGLRLAGLREGDAVAVLGSGVSGILQIQAARALGAGPILATDVSEPRLEFARRFGADEAASAVEGSVIEQMKALNDGRLAERVIVCTGARPAFEQALELVDLGGSILFFAPLPPGETLALPVNDLWKRGVSIVHSYAGPPDDMWAALEMIASGRIDVAGMVTHRLPLERTGEGFRLMVEGRDSLKVVVEPQR
jgi:L-iditol 2-dehydrogenase